MNVAEIRELFPGLRDTIYLNTATMAVGSTPAKDAYQRGVAQWCAGRFDWLEAERAGEECRGVFAQLIGAAPENIAIVPAVSTAAGIVAANLPEARPGENVIVAGGEFSSNFFPWLLLQERGYDVRVVPASDEDLSAEDFGHRADGGTRVVAVSAVHAGTGHRRDLAAFSRVAARSGAWLFVDACQAAGAVELDVLRDGVDFLAAASHKFLLGSRGMGYLFVHPRRLGALRPIIPGWKAARMPLQSFFGPAMDLSPTASKLDGSLTWFAALAEQAGMGIFGRFGIKAIVERNSELSDHLEAALLARGAAARPRPKSAASTIFSIRVHDTDAVMARLRAANVVASVREGRVRLSIHFYNLEEELDRVAELIGRQ